MVARRTAIVERAPMFHARLLGGRSLRLGDEPVMLDSARAECLLTYLLLHRDGALPRERIAFVLWPDSTEPQARMNLRHLLHTLRRALPEADRFIEVRPRTLQWRAEAPLQLDVALFEQAIADGRLEDAVDAYAGELLEGSYDQWLLEERERLAVLYVDARGLPVAARAGAAARGGYPGVPGQPAARRAGRGAAAANGALAGRSGRRSALRAPDGGGRDRKEPPCRGTAVLLLARRRGDGGGTLVFRYAGWLQELVGWNSDGRRSFFADLERVVMHRWPLPPGT